MVQVGHEMGGLGGFRCFFGTAPCYQNAAVKSLELSNVCKQLEAVATKRFIERTWVLQHLPKLPNENQHFTLS